MTQLTQYPTSLWHVQTCFGVQRKLASIIHQFHDGMRVGLRLDDGECSDWLSVDQGLRLGCVLAPPLFIIYVTVTSDVYKRLDADSAVRGIFVRINLREANGGATVMLWAILRAILAPDYVGVASLSP